jgi:hypothetical protein
MNNLAAVLRGQGKREEAEEMHREALRPSETVLGKEHPDTLTIMGSLANMLRNQASARRRKRCIDKHSCYGRLCWVKSTHPHKQLLPSTSPIILLLRLTSPKQKKDVRLLW